MEQYHVGQGVVRGGAAQYGGFLGLLASIGVPLAIGLVKKVLGKGLQTQPPRPRRSPDPHLLREEECKCNPHLSSERGMIIKKIIKFKDTPLSNIDLRKWCDFLRIPIKGILAEMKRNLCSIPRALSTWMILEAWELIGCVVGMPKMAGTSILIHLGFTHL